MKPNYLGIVGGILALFSIALPWWTMSLSAGNIGVSADFSIYPYMASSGVIDIGVGLYQFAIGLLVILLVVMGGASAIASGVKPDKMKNFYRWSKWSNIAQGILTLASAIYFAIGLQLALLWRWMPIYSSSNVFLFGSGSLYFGGERLNYFSYLSFGFWLALAASIIMMVAFRKKPV